MWTQWRRKSSKKDEWIIRQGADGDDFYILQRGKANCYLKIGDGDRRVEKHVKTYGPGESFGELALMYNCPRAASIQAVSDVSVWALDRQTFRSVLMQLTAGKRSIYESFLSQVPILSTLDRYERSKIADALVERTCTAGERIIRKGDAGPESDNFYILVEGKVSAFKQLGNEQSVNVRDYGVGDYFGELSLLTSQARAADVTAVTECRLVQLDRHSFERLLGPCQDILKRNAEMYSKIDESIRKSLENISMSN